MVAVPKLSPSGTRRKTRQQFDIKTSLSSGVFGGSKTEKQRKLKGLVLPPYELFARVKRQASSPVFCGNSEPTRTKKLRARAEAVLVAVCGVMMLRKKTLAPPARSGRPGRT